ncbi:MAG TPA: tetratricopeptide repeat protein [Bacteroidia bacterium]|nr:tetratricopeptide repeat protein [Bacteroidia bacterium]
MVFTQNLKIDSLKKILDTDKEDTNKVIHLNSLSRQYFNIGSYDSTLRCANTALQIAGQLAPVYKRGIAGAYNNMGIVYWYEADYPKALEYDFKALKIVEELHDKKGLAKSFGNIGLVYWNQGDLPKALDYFFKTLKMMEELKDKKGIAIAYGNIGLVYADQSDFSRALDYDFKALKIAEEIGEKDIIARNLGNIGLIYRDQNDYPKALDYYFKALKIDEELKNKRGMAIRLGNIGSLYTKQNKYKDASIYIYRAIAIASSIKAMNDVKDNYSQLSRLYENATVSLPDTFGGKLLNLGEMRLRALYYYKRYIALRDTLFSEENKKQLLRKEMNYEFDKKEIAAKAEQEKLNAISAEEKKKQQIVTYAVAGLLVLVIVFSLFLFTRFRITQRQKVVIEKQKILVDHAYESLHEKNKEVIDSIHYAKRIQNALITSEKYIATQLNRLMKSR